MSCPRHKPAAGYLRTISTCTPPCTSRRTRTSTCRLLTWTKCLAIRYPFRAALAGIQTGCQRRDLPLLVGPACTPCRAEGRRRFPKGPRQTPSQGSKHTPRASDLLPRAALRRFSVSLPLRVLHAMEFSNIRSATGGVSHLPLPPGIPPEALTSRASESYAPARAHRTQVAMQS